MTHPVHFRSRPLPVVLLLLASSGCGDGGPGRLTPLGDKDPCPVPGPGITLGGDVSAGNAHSQPINRLVLMGGGSHNDEAGTLFLDAAEGGDVVVLRATGSTSSYSDYFKVALAPGRAPASVVTIRTDDPAAGGDLGVLCRVNRAEALWLADGDQWDYLQRWHDDLQTAINRLTGRGGVVGGISAGAVALGQAAFDAEAGAVTSEDALADPLRAEVSISVSTIGQPELSAALVDTHFSESDREGRLLAFMARVLADLGVPQVLGLGLDEGTALVMEPGSYRVFGPEGSGVWAYAVTGPATLVPGAPLGLEGIRRVRLNPGTQGTWPLDFDLLLADALRVENGVVVPGGG